MENDSQIQAGNESEQALVVLIHGLAAHRILLWPLSFKLRSAGYQTASFGYRSWLGSIETHAERFEQFLARHENDAAIHHIHIVAHSMGAIVTRQAILNRRLKKLRRVVMLGAPNQGSPTARLLGNALPFCKTLRQISNHPDSFVRKLPEPTDVEIGIVAAKHDRVVSESSSHLKNEADHVSIFSGHNGLLVRPAALRQVCEFLDHGRFQPSGDQSRPKDDWTTGRNPV